MWNAMLESGILEALASGQRAALKIRDGARLAAVELRRAAEKNTIVLRLADVLDDFAVADGDERARVLRKVLATGTVLCGRLLAKWEPCEDAG